MPRSRERSPGSTSVPHSADTSRSGVGLGPPTHFIDGKPITPFVQVPSWLVAHVGFQESPIDLRHIGMFAVLCTWANKDRTCMPSVKTIAKRANVSVATVRTYLLVLEAVGAIKRTARSRGHGKGQTTNLFRLADESGPFDVTSVRAGVTKSTEVADLVQPVGGRGSSRLEGGESSRLDPMNHNHVELHKQELQKKIVIKDDDILLALPDGELGPRFLEAVSTNRRLHYACSRLHGALLLHFPSMNDKHLWFRTGTLVKAVSDVADDEEFAEAVLSISLRLSAKHERVLAGKSEPLQSPNALNGFIDKAIKMYEYGHFWSDHRNTDVLDLAEEWETADALSLPAW